MQPLDEYSKSIQNRVTDSTDSFLCLESVHFNYSTLAIMCWDMLNHTVFFPFSDWKSLSYFKEDKCVIMHIFEYFSH